MVHERPIDAAKAATIAPITATGQVTPFLIDSTAIHGRLVRLGAAGNQILRRHEIPPQLAQPLGELMALAGLMAAGQKQEAIVSISIHGEAGLATSLICDAHLKPDGEIALRASYQLRGEGALAKIAELPLQAVSGDNQATSLLQSLLGDGYMMVTLDPMVGDKHSQSPDDDDAPQTGKGQRTQAVTKLLPAGLTATAQHFYEQSTQIDSWCLLACQNFGTAANPLYLAAGFLLQQLPPENPNKDSARHSETRNNDWQHAQTLIATLTADELCDSQLSEDELLWRFFHQEKLIIFPKQDYKDECRCSRQRMYNILSRISAAERQEMQLDNGGYEVKCMFCNQAHNFTEKDFA